MSVATGLCLTGLLVIAAALPQAIVITSQYKARQRQVTTAWATFATGVLLLAAAIWVEVLS